MGTNYKFDTCRIQPKESKMSKKVISISFRTTDENSEYLKSLAESDDRSLSYVLNKMVDSFRSKKVKDIRKIK